MKTRKHRKLKSIKHNKMSKHRRKRYSNRKTRRKVLIGGGWSFSKDLSKLTLAELDEKWQEKDTEISNYKKKHGFVISPSSGAKHPKWDKLHKERKNIEEAQALKEAQAQALKEAQAQAQAQALKEAQAQKEAQKEALEAADEEHGMRV